MYYCILVMRSLHARYGAHDGAQDQNCILNTKTLCAVCVPVLLCLTVCQCVSMSPRFPNLYVATSLYTHTCTTNYTIHMCHQLHPKGPLRAIFDTGARAHQHHAVYAACSGPSTPLVRQRLLAPHLRSRLSLGRARPFLGVCVDERELSFVCA